MTMCTSFHVGLFPWYQKEALQNKTKLKGVTQYVITSKQTNKHPFIANI